MTTEMEIFVWKARNIKILKLRLWVVVFMNLFSKVATSVLEDMNGLRIDKGYRLYFPKGVEIIMWRVLLFVGALF